MLTWGISDCCDTLRVVGEYFTGTYTRGSDLYNGSPTYKHSDGGWCIFYEGHWKIEECKWLTGDKDGSQGIGWTEERSACPENIGSKWRYYSSWSKGGGPASGPVNTEIAVECMQ